MPSYSRKASDGWYFSDLAIEAIKEYHEAYPGLFNALRTRRNEDRDIECRFVFPDDADVDYSARKLVKYCNACAFKKLRLSPTQYMALTESGVLAVTAAVDAAYATLAGRQIRVES